MQCQKQKVNRPESYVGVLELRLLFFLNFSEERGFLRVDWDCFLTFGDFGIFYHMVHNGSWSCVLSWATCRFVAPRNSGQELRCALRPGTCQGETGPRGELPIPLQRYWVVGCQRHRHGLLSSHLLHWARRRALRMREGTVCPWHELDLDIGLLVQRNSIVQSGTVLIFAIHCGLYLHSWLNTGLRNQKPFTTFSLFFKKKKSF